MNATNSTGLGASWHSPYSSAVQVIIWIVASLLSLETIIGNAMVIVAYRLERSISKQVSNRYIVSLAISDLIIGIEGIPLFTVYVVNGDRWPLGAIACETWLFLDYTLCLVSILTVLLITADRYLSVCHTAKYLKWQSPTKTQILIILSWVFPAVMFGIMIYGWSFVGGENGGNADYEEGECFAPFLSNPYVNMGMYVAYYWTTLVAMLILYKGIHKAAKNLEKKAKAKEHRHIALLLTQRLGTQVGVSLMLQSRRHDSLQNEANRDSGYHTNVNNLSTSPGDTAESATLEVIREATGQAKAGTQVIRRQRLTEQNSIDKHDRTHMALRPCKSALPAIRNEEEEPLRGEAHLQALSVTDTLSEKSDTTSVLCRTQSHRASKSSHKRSRKWRRSAENIHDNNQVVSVTDENGKLTTTVEYIVDDQEIPVTRGWMATLRQKLSWLARPNTPGTHAQMRQNHSIRSRSSSASSSGSSMNDASVHEHEPVHKMPTVTITRENVSGLSVETKRSDGYLSTMGASRKASTLSTFTKDTRDRVLQSLFSPIVALNRSRKQTKAEKRAHKAFRTITFIVGFFAILWSPYYVVATVYGFCKGECVPSILYNLAYYMCYLNSSGNPFAYALANRQFRLAFLRMFRGNFKRVT